MACNPGDAPILQEEQVTPYWSIFLHPLAILLYITALVLFLLWLPATVRMALLTALRANGVVLGLILAFALVALSLLWADGQRLDSLIFLHINLHGHRPRWLDGVMWSVTQLGSLAAAVIVIAVLFILPFRTLGVIVVLGSVTLGMLVETFKAITDRVRPCHALRGARVVGWLHRGRSFPSGHTAQTFFLVTLFSHQLPLSLWGILLLYVLATMVGVTRVYVGAHYPRDVLGGAALGTVWALLVIILVPQLAGMPM